MNACVCARAQDVDALAEESGDDAAGALGEMLDALLTEVRTSRGAPRGAPCFSVSPIGAPLLGGARVARCAAAHICL